MLNRPSSLRRPSPWTVPLSHSASARRADSRGSSSVAAWASEACLLAGLLVLTVPACTDYKVLTQDGAAGDGGGGASVGAVGGSGGRSGTGGAMPDAGMPDLPGDHLDAPAMDTGSADTGVDFPGDTGPSPLANGASCRAGIDCQSGSCVDGVCCESACAGVCQSCAEPNLLGKCVTIGGAPRGTVRARCPGQGTCAAVCNGSDPLSCQYPRSEKQCVAASCSAGVAKVASTCNGAGACTVVTGTPCASNLCADPTQCAGGCSTAQPCGAGQYCEPTTRACLPLKGLGTPCAGPTECLLGFCVDGVCCNNLCNGVCVSCKASQTGQPADGTCAPVLNGTDPANECTASGTACGLDGFCGGGACRFAVSGTSCGSAMCNSGMLISARRCDGLGNCPPGQASSCAAGTFCSGAACVPQVANGGACQTGPQCASGNCTGNLCCAAGQTGCSGLCVNLANDNAHCGICTRACDSSSSFCSGGACVCSPGFHACSTKGGCFSNSDATNCGPTCTSCARPNQNPICAATSGTCDNTCVGTALRCSAGTTLHCGSWDFESNTTEGWAESMSLPPGRTAVVSTARAASGTHALAATFNGVGLVQFKVSPCGAQGAFDLIGGHAIRFSMFIDTAAGTTFVGSSVDPMQGPVLLGQIDYTVPPPGQWGQVSVISGEGIPGVTDLAITVAPPLQGASGTIYIDDIQIL